MYHYRLKILIMLCVGGLIIAVGRLLTLQTFQAKKARQELADMRIMALKQRPTVRGKILDRYGNSIAIDKPAFFLHINYQLTRYRDSRWREARILRALTEEKTRAEVERELYEEKWKQSIEDLERSIDLAWQLADVSREEIEGNIKQINDQVWEQSRYVWWKRRNQDKTWQQYRTRRESISIRDIVAVDLAEMYQTYPLVELKTQQDLQRAQKELLLLKHLKIKSEAKREYPYDTAACQLIGWVAPWRQSEAEIFKDDAYMSYTSGEVVGKFGLEKVYEPVLRGRRGAVRYDVEGNLLERIEPQYGRDVRLTIDIDLQQKIEAMLATSTIEGKLSAAVVLEVANNDILAMASTPTFNLNTIRKEYNAIFNNPRKPLMHRALQQNYPPGSTAKPLILVAGLEEKKITPGEVITCGFQPPTKSWPRCISQWKFHNPHSNKWTNNGRNAIRGSCNIYFSRLANRLDARDLQEWFFKFGYGRDILPAPMPEDVSEDEAAGRRIRQAAGSIIYGVQTEPYTEFSQVPEIPSRRMSEKRYWGIGQGNLRVTVLQVANALSAIARGGIYKQPRLIDAAGDFINQPEERSLGISRSTLNTVRDGMWAVANEDGGTAYRVFSDSPLRTQRNMKIYGKTGSTQNPSMAWFECFAEENSGRAIVIVVLVEGGLSGSGEAAPLGEKVLDLCNRAGYIGSKPTE
ncbi:MAG: penicillin-binding transpeptidase domain-containing protein [Planctomycetota bacterium]|jgi:penicillin-binding protein 2